MRPETIDDSKNESNVLILLALLARRFWIEETDGRKKINNIPGVCFIFAIYFN